MDNSKTGFYMSSDSSWQSWLKFMGSAGPYQNIHSGRWSSSTVGCVETRATTVHETSEGLSVTVYPPSASNTLKQSLLCQWWEGSAHRHGLRISWSSASDIRLWVLQIKFEHIRGWFLFFFLVSRSLQLVPVSSDLNTTRTEDWPSQANRELKDHHQNASSSSSWNMHWSCLDQEENFSVWSVRTHKLGTWIS